MKKILSFVLVLFLVFFLWPKGTLATTACCSSGSYIDRGPAVKGCCNQAICLASFDLDNSKYQCGNYTCDASSQQCTSKLINIDPVCPGGYDEVKAFLGKCDAYSDKCCKTTWGMCLNKNDPSSGWINKCDEIAANAILVDKNACSDSTFRYNKDTKKCEKFVESMWILNSTCDNNTAGVQTAIGCVPTGDLTAFLKFVLKWVFFASGGIILLMVIATGYTIITSQGNPEKLQAAKENIVALLSGLAMIAFSLILLQVIGANILGLPTF